MRKFNIFIVLFLGILLHSKAQTFSSSPSLAIPDPGTTTDNIAVTGIGTITTGLTYLESVTINVSHA